MPGSDILNLGAKQQPVLLFGGPYSNLQATEALLNRARDLAIEPSNIICTGDVVAYAGDPAATTERVMSSGMQVVMGNCEESFGFEEDDCGCGFAEGSACDVLSRQWYAHASNELTADHRAWMRSLPRQIRFEMAGQQVAVIHGGTRDISRWVFASTPQAIKREEIAILRQDGPVDVVVGGHCGVPFAHDLDDALWVNAGVIGMPANDGTARTWFTVLTPTDGGLQVVLHALDYSHAEAADRMNRLDLAGAYAETLVDGHWPNLDVLPPAERLQTGQPLDAWSMEWQRPFCPAPGVSGWHRSAAIQPA